MKVLVRAWPDDDVPDVWAVIDFSLIQSSLLKVMWSALVAIESRASSRGYGSYISVRVASPYVVFYVMEGRNEELDFMRAGESSKGSFPLGTLTSEQLARIKAWEPADVESNNAIVNSYGLFFRGYIKNRPVSVEVETEAFVWSDVERWMEKE